ncbi:hypothetical protein GCM10022243_38460 [Saccharothrix violaceirubra]|uniref:Tetratricopeptide (TPR) repeat protein n=1 Tax=Saccharothrix violaceirubra TaxID=413306 RepID=A0A7W7WUK5_9PSEU|nr:hypothetical protein [Saccharothrix violaceirubra]MBB4964369.1 tetratricopeptide (TPR) repeat protein [Saccharothrix violaceirubra]
MSDRKQAAERQFVDAYHMPEGMPRHEALERAARTADDCDHLPLGVSCRIALLRSSHDLGRYDLMLPAFAWLGTAEQRDASAFDEWEVHNYDWAHKWIVHGLLGDPRFSRAQIDSVVAALEDRYRRHGFSMQPVHGARTDVAESLGDAEAYREHFARYLATERGPMSDCEACVIEEQAGHLIRQGRYAEAVAHAEHQLERDNGCATQPQGILTTLTPAFVALGDLDRARDAHVVAHRLVRDDEAGPYLSDHLEFCATSGNVRRGVDLLQRHLHRVHHSPSPSQAMYFSAAAALLLSRVDFPVEFAVPRDGVTTSTSATALRAALEARAVELAARFDERNGSSATGDRVRAILTAADTVPVPLIVPVPSLVVPPIEEPPVVADPVELAERMAEAFDQGDFVTGIRMLRSLPAELDPLLPEHLAALVAVRRALVEGHGRQRDEVLAEVDSALDRLRAAGEHDLANRFLGRSMTLRLDTLGHDACVERLRACIAEADRSGTPYSRVLLRLLLADVFGDSDDSEQQSELILEAAALAEESVPELVSRVRCDGAQLQASTGELDAAYSTVTRLLASSPGPSVRFDALRLKVKLETVRGDEAAMDTAELFVADFASPRGPWVAETHRQRVASVERLGLEGDYLPQLRDAVAVGHDLGVPDDVAKACYALAGGYLKGNRFVEAAEALEEAVRILESAEVDPDIVVPVRYRLGQTCARLGELAEARGHLETALGLVDESEPWRMALVLDVLGGVLRRQESPNEAAAAYARAARCWQEVSEAAEAAGSWVESASALPEEENQACLEALEAATALLPEVAEEHHRTHLTARVAAIRAFVHTRMGEFAEAIERNTVAEELAAQLDDADWRTFLVARGARFHLDSGDPATAEAEARRAATLMTDQTPHQILGDTAAVLEESLRAQDKPTADPLLRALTARLDD